MTTTPATRYGIFTFNRFAGCYPNLPADHPANAKVSRVHRLLKSGARSAKPVTFKTVDEALRYCRTNIVIRSYVGMYFIAEATR